MNTLRPYLIMKIEGGVPADQQRHAAGAALGKAKAVVLVVVPMGAGERGPDGGRTLLAEIEEACSGRGEQPFVKAADIGIAADVAQVHGDVPHRLRAVDYGED